MVQREILLLLSPFLLMGLTSGKRYDKCQLAKELREVFATPEEQIPTWVCIASFVPNLETTTVSAPNPDGSRDHGIFQINDKYWCSPPGTGRGCGLPCSRFANDFIVDDYKCAKEIYQANLELTGNGFASWPNYDKSCKDVKEQDILKGCGSDSLDTV